VLGFSIVMVLLSVAGSNLLLMKRPVGTDKLLDLHVI
jgi:hypothetical protein